MFRSEILMYVRMKFLQDLPNKTYIGMPKSFLVPTKMYGAEELDFE